MQDSRFKVPVCRRQYPLYFDFMLSFKTGNAGVDASLHFLLRLTVLPSASATLNLPMHGSGDCMKLPDLPFDRLFPHGYVSYHGEQMTFKITKR